MKRAAPWSDGEEEDDDRSSSDTDSSTLDTDTDNDTEDEKDSTEKTAAKSKASSKLKASQVESANKKQKRKKGLDLEALRRHGYKGGLSVMGVPPPREAVDEKQDWSWSKGLETRAKETEETFTDRQMTRAAILQGEQLLPNAASSARDKRELSFSQKEKRKRDLGQASRGKNYVEEEKRLLRESGIYSGFDS